MGAKSAKEWAYSRFDSLWKQSLEPRPVSRWFIWDGIQGVGEWPPPWEPGKSNQYKDALSSCSPPGKLEPNSARIYWGISCDLLCGLWYIINFQKCFMCTLHIFGVIICFSKFFCSLTVSIFTNWHYRIIWSDLFFPWGLTENTRNKFQSRFVLAVGCGIWFGCGMGKAQDGMPELQRLRDTTFALW